MTARKTTTTPLPDDVVPETSDQQKLLLKISMASDAMTNPKKATPNPGFKGSKYATLQDTMTVIEPILREVGLAHCTTFDGTQIVYTVWDIDTGHAFGSKLDIGPIMEGLTGNVWQQIGQAFTYLRRYLAQAFWNLVPEDDDAHTAPQRATSPARTRKAADKPYESGDEALGQTDARGATETGVL